MAGYLDILRPQVLTRVVRQVVASADPILNFMGFQPGGFNEVNEGHGRTGTYHIYDDTRQVGKTRAPGTAAGRSSKQGMKAVNFTYPRMHDSISIQAEFFNNIGKIDNPAVRDEAGRTMIERQTKTLSTKAANWRIAMTVGMLRDSLYFTEDGDDWHINYTSTSSLGRVNFQVPAGNKTQGNMTDRAGTSVHGSSIFAISLDNTTADLVLYIDKVNQARSVQGVGPVRHIHCNNRMWNYIRNLEVLAAMAGIVNPPFMSYDRVAGTRPDGTALHEYTGTVNALPGITFHITDEGLELWDAATSAFVFQKHFPDTMLVMMGDPVGEKYSAYLGSEPIAEYDGGPETIRTGTSAWSKKVSNPTATEVYVLDNCLTVPHDPYDIDIITAVF